MSTQALYRPTLRALRAGFTPAGWINEDATNFLVLYGCEKTAAHCAKVAKTAWQLAERFGVDSVAAETAGWLHDVSAVWPNDQRLAAAEALGVDTLPEEREAPMLLHQKLSVVLAREIFGVRDANILSAIGCHTTLKGSPAQLDKVLFAADKLSWDQPGEGVFHPAMREALSVSLDEAIRVYLRHLWDQRDQLPVFHPWTMDACRYFGIIEQ